jgi:hypothetical protein
MRCDGREGQVWRPGSASRFEAKERCVLEGDVLVHTHLKQFLFLEGPTPCHTKQIREKKLALLVSCPQSRANGSGDRRFTPVGWDVSTRNPPDPHFADPDRAVQDPRLHLPDDDPLAKPRPDGSVRSSGYAGHYLMQGSGAVPGACSAHPYAFPSKPNRKSGSRAAQRRQDYQLEIDQLKYTIMNISTRRFSRNQPWTVVEVNHPFPPI